MQDNSELNILKSDGEHLAWVFAERRHGAEFIVNDGLIWHRYTVNKNGIRHSTEDDIGCLLSPESSIGVTNAWAATLLVRALQRAFPVIKEDE
jgi:hypothetical protein